MNRVEQYLTDKLTERANAGNMRQLPLDRAGIDFYSNDYLGIATLGHTHSSGSAMYSKGATGSRLISGNSDYTEEVEAFIANFHRAEAALIFNSGYDANMGLLSAIAGRDTVFIYDELCHASIIDGVRQSLCRHKYRYNHNDTTHLEELLIKNKDAGQLIVITEAIFSMDGDMAPLSNIAQLCTQYGAELIVDEAHATGVIGAKGEGLVCKLGLENQVFARVHTFGKALGCHGAAVVGSKLLCSYLVNFARTFIYTTALPPSAVHTIHESYLYLASTYFSNLQLHDNIAYFREKIATSGNRGWMQSNSPIQGLVTGGNNATRQLASTLQDAGLRITPILHPTVPIGKERLRICLHTFNTREEIDLIFKNI